MNTVLLTISLVLGAIGIITVILGYKKDKTDNPQAAAILGRRIFILALVVAVLNSVVPLLKQFKPSPSPPVTEEQVEQLFIKYRDLFKKPSIEEVKIDIKTEFRAISLKKEEEALNLYKKGDLAYDESRFTEAVYYFSEVLETIESASVYLTKGNALFFLSRKDEAIAAYEKALKINPDNAKAWNNKGVALDDLGRKDEAMAAYEKALEIKPGHAESWNNKGAALSALGRKDEAIAAFEKALEIKPDYADAWHGKGSVLSALDRKDEAIVAYEKALEIKPDYADVWYNKGNDLSTLGRKNEAIAAYEKAIEVKPDFAKAWYNKGSVLSGLGRNNEAIDAFERALKIFESTDSPYIDIIQKRLAENKPKK